MARKAYLGGSNPSNNLSGAANTYYFALGQDFFQNSSITEANADMVVRADATLRNLTVLIATNSKGTNTVYTVRVNGAASALTVTIPASTTGVFQDTSNDVTITTGDVFCLEVVTGGSGNHFFRGCLLEIEADAGNAHTYISHRQGFSSSTNTNWGQMFASGGFGWNSGGGSLTNAGSATPMPAAGVFSHLRTVVTTNTKASGNCLLRLQKNGAATTSMVLTIPFGTTGVFEDTSNTESFAQGDTAGWYLTTAGTGTLTLANLQVMFTGDADATPLMSGNGGARAIGSTTYPLVVGSRNNITPEADAQMPALFDATIDNFYLRGNFNASPNHEIAWRLNGADSGLINVITVSGVNTISDTTNSFSVVAGDDINQRETNNSAAIINSTSYAAAVRVTNPGAPAGGNRNLVMQQAA